MKKINFTSFKKICLGLIIVGGTLFFALVSIIYSQYGQAFTEQADCGVIFGAAVWRDDQPSHALYDRTIAGINLVKSKQIHCLVLSGGPSTYGAHEVSVMKKMIYEQNLKDLEIIEDFHGTNTLQTIKNLDPNRSYVMISNDFHLARIRLLAWREKIQKISVHAAEYDSGRYHKESYFVLREVAGIVFYGLHLDQIDF
jgi:vancomycin permeability regulator SanA